MDGERKKSLSAIGMFTQAYPQRFCLPDQGEVADTNKKEEAENETQLVEPKLEKLNLVVGAMVASKHGFLLSRERRHQLLMWLIVKEDLHHNEKTAVLGKVPPAIDRLQLSSTLAIVPTPLPFEK